MLSPFGTSTEPIQKHGLASKRGRYLNIFSLVPDKYQLRWRTLKAPCQQFKSVWRGFTIFDINRGDQLIDQTEDTCCRTISSVTKPRGIPYGTSVRTPIRTFADLNELKTGFVSGKQRSLCRNTEKKAAAAE